MTDVGVRESQSETDIPLASHREWLHLDAGVQQLRSALVHEVEE